jgi:hypothetical protein
MAVIVALVLFAAGCALLLLVRAVARDWRVVAGLGWTSASDSGLDEPEPPHTNGSSPAHAPSSHSDPFNEFWLTPEPVPTPADGNGHADGDGHADGNGNGNGNGSSAERQASANLD